MNHVCLLLLFITVGLVSALSCTSDKFETDPCLNVSYAETIKPMIQSKCAVSGCHVSGFQPGDFTQYETLKKKADDGKIQLMVFSLGNMPPENKLSSSEKSLLQCWLNAGAEKN